MDAPIRLRYEGNGDFRVLSNWLDLLAGKFRDLKASLPDADGVFPGDVASNPLVQNYSAM